MFEAHFQLKDNPFGATTEPEFIYQSPGLREAMDHFSYAVESREAFVLLTGAVGTGKTTAVRVFRQQLPTEMPLALVSHTTLTPRELVDEVALRFGLPLTHGESKPCVVHRLENLFVERRAGGLTSALLIVDEAHLLSAAALEEVRLLSNLERGGERLIQVFLVGQPELENRLRQPELWPFRQRINVRYELKPLGFEETRQYVAHRLRAAGSRRPFEFFTEEALEAVHQLSQGLPRGINAVAGHGMLSCYVEDSDSVTVDHVKSVTSCFAFEEGDERPRSEEPEAAAHAAPQATSPVTATSEEPPDFVVVSDSRDSSDSRRRAPTEDENARHSWDIVGSGWSWRKGAWVAAGLLVLVTVVGYSLLEKRASAPTGGETARSTSSPTDDGAPAPVEESDASSEESTPSRPNPPHQVGEAALDRTDEAVLLADDPIVAEEEGQEERLALPSVAGASEGLESGPKIILDEDAVVPGFSEPVTIQIASLLDRDRAEQALARISDKTGLPGVVQSIPVGEATWYIVLLGSFKSLQEGERSVRSLLGDENISDVVIKPAPKRWQAHLAGMTDRRER